MNIINELRELPDSRKIVFHLLAALAVWVSCISLFLFLTEARDEMDSRIDVDARIINSAMVYRSMPHAVVERTAQKSSAEPLGQLSGILDALKLRDKVVQLQSNISGLSVQFEKLYGSEMKEFLITLESRGMTVKNAELRVMPSGDDRLITASFLLE